MKYESIRKLLYLERFVNSGSPTGLTFTQSSSDPTSPLYCCAAFRLPFISVPNEEAVTFTNRWENTFASGNGNLLLPVHPDVVRRLRQDYLSQVVWEPIHYRDAVPTASPRTVFVWDSFDRPCFVKLDFPLILGRFPSDLWGEKLWIGPKISQYLARFDAVDDREIFFLPEVDAVEGALYLDGGLGGAVLRLLQILGTHRTVIDDIDIVPAFSLFGEGHLEAKPEPLLIEMLRDYDRPIDVFLNAYIVPVLEAYWHMSIFFGLIPEAHSQNLLFGYVHGSETPIVVWRDFQGFYRDEAFIATELDAERAGTYHLIGGSDSTAAQMRRSFLYDWVLGHYFLDPMIGCYLHAYPGEESSIMSCVRDITHQYVAPIKKYLPNNAWYSMLLNAPAGEKLEMLENQNPRYR